MLYEITHGDITHLTEIPDDWEEYWKYVKITTNGTDTDWGNKTDTDWISVGLYSDAEKSLCNIRPLKDIESWATQLANDIKDVDD